LQILLLPCKIWQPFAKDSTTMKRMPRGVQEVRYKTADKKTQVKYRVRINSKELNVKVDKLFSKLEEAVEYLHLMKTGRGREVVYSLEEKKKKYDEVFDSIVQAPPLTMYINLYIKQYIDTRERKTDLQIRNYKNILSFYNTIKKTKIDIKHSVKALMPNVNVGGTFWALGGNTRKAFGDFKPIEIGPYEINSYIRNRLALGMAKISVSRELTFISRFFEKLKYIDPHFENLPNPVKSHDKDLLKNRIHKRVFRLDEDVETKLFTALKQYKNPQMYQIVLLSLLTSCRRSEIVTLEWEQIKENHIDLWHTKSGKPRKVYLTKEAKEFIATIPKRANDPRLFTYKIMGFEGSFNKFKEELGLKSLRMHDMRRESIARFVEKVGNNSLILSEILGFESVRKLEASHIEPNLRPTVDTQQGLQKHFGHSTASYTKVYYNFNTKK